MTRSLPLASSDLPGPPRASPEATRRSPFDMASPFDHDIRSRHRSRSRPHHGERKAQDHNPSHKSRSRSRDTSDSPRRFQHVSSAHFASKIVWESTPEAKSDQQPSLRGIEFIAGHAGISESLEAQGAAVTAVDWAGNQHKPSVPITPIDLCSIRGREDAFEMLGRPKPHFVWLAPHCGTFHEHAIALCPPKL